VEPLRLDDACCRSESPNVEIHLLGVLARSLGKRNKSVLRVPFRGGRIGVDDHAPAPELLGNAQGDPQRLRYQGVSQPLLAKR